MSREKIDQSIKKPLHKQNKLIIILLFWIVVIGAVVVFNESILRSGEEVFLETRPVDPRDLFRGDYMILSYDISQITADDASLPAGIGQGDTIYLRLSVDENKIASPIAILKKEPTEGLFIKGTVTRVPSPVSISVDYGIESYFIPEDTGRNFPRITEVLVSIDGNGRAKIKGVYNNMTEIDPSTINPQ